MKHSPGRWEAEFVGHSGPGDNPEEVWEVNNGHARIAEYMTEADARLVAAAPEMLAALVKIDKLAREADTDANSQTVLALQVGIIAQIALDKATQSNI